MMRSLLRLLCLVLLAVASTPLRAADLTVSANSYFLIDAWINGHPVRLRVDPGGSGYVVLNPATVERIGLERSMLRSSTRIGPIRLDGWSKVARVRIGETEGRRRLVWIDRPVVEDADGLISPADMPYDLVTFELGAERQGARDYVLPLEFPRGEGLYYPFPAGDQQVHVKFSLIKAHSMATGAAGALLSGLFGGSWMGDPRDALIDFGVARPVRPLALERPLSLEGLELDRFFVRTGDHRGNLELPPEPDADPDEIVVTGAGGKRQRARYGLTIGLDRLSSCSRLVWNNLNRQLTLRCAPVG